MFQFSHFRSALRASKFSKPILAVLLVGLVSSALIAVNSQPPAGAAGIAPTCSGPVAAQVNEQVTFTAAGGNGTYSWSSAQLNASGPTYRVAFPNTGNKIITLTSGGASTTCNIRISAGGNGGGNVSDVVCAGPSTLAVNEQGTWTATGGNGTYNWSSAQLNASGATYRVAFPNGGPKTITVTSGGKTDTCNVNVTNGGGNGGSNSPLDVTCSGSPLTVSPGGTVTWTAHPTGGNGSYTFNWAGNGTFPDGKTGQTVQATYPGGAGTRNAQVTVTSAGQTKTSPTCSVNVVDNGGGNGACAPLQFDRIAISGSRATVQVSNPNSTANCAQDVSLISYNTSDSPWNGSNRSDFLANQDEIDFTTRSIAPGANSVPLSVSIPQCEFQVDLYKGTSPVSAPQLDGIGTLTWVISSGISTLPGRQCATPTPTPPPQPHAPICTVVTPNVNVGDPATFKAAGGNGFFFWNAVEGNPSSNSGVTFVTHFASPGWKTVTVTSDGLTATCNINIQQQISNDLKCSPGTQTVDVGETASFFANGGSGNYSWTGGGSPATQNGPRFDTSFSSSGGRTVTVHDGQGHSAQCQVIVTKQNQLAPVCRPSTQDANVGDSVHFTATGGDGSFTWRADNGSPRNGNGSSFDTEFDDSGTFLVTVTSNGLTDSCVVHVDEEQDNDLSCSPSRQDVDSGDYASFTARGGSGSYTWRADDGSPRNGNGRTFTSRFFDEGRSTVTVTDSRGRTATCRVDVNENFNPRSPSCSPSSQTANVNQQVTFYGNGGTGNFSWRADNGSPTFGYGSSFSTSFSSPGQYDVVLNSNGERDTCTVNVQQINNGAPFCSPSTQSANIGDFVTFTATGGNGTFFWNTPVDGTPTSGSGSSFGTRFTTAGTKIVTVNSNGQTSQCIVQIGQVLGASTVVTGPTDAAFGAIGLGFLGAFGAYSAYYRKNPKELLKVVLKRIRTVA